MVKIVMSFHVHLGFLKYDSMNNIFEDEQIGIFVKELEIPFTPFIGLQIYYKKLLTPPITTITYYEDEELFSCGFAEDMGIPNTAYEIVEAKNIDWAPNDVLKYMGWATNNRKKTLIDEGWEFRGVI